MDRCVVCRDSDWLLGRGSNRRIVGQSPAQRVLPWVGGDFANRRRGESLLPTVDHPSLAETRLPIAATHYVRKLAAEAQPPRGLGQSQLRANRREIDLRSAWLAALGVLNLLQEYIHLRTTGFAADGLAGCLTAERRDWLIDPARVEVRLVLSDDRVHFCRWQLCGESRAGLSVRDRSSRIGVLAQPMLEESLTACLLYTSRCV